MDHGDGQQMAEFLLWPGQEVCLDLTRQGKPQMAGWVLGHQIRLASTGTRGIVHSAPASSCYICVPKRSLAFIKPGYNYTSHLHICDGNILRVKFTFIELIQKPDLPACIKFVFILHHGI